MKGKKKLSVEAASEGALTLSLGALMGKEPQQELPKEEKIAVKREISAKVGSTLTFEEQLLTVQQVTLHRQKAGWGGKTVTLVTLKGGCVKPEELSRSLRKGLGCGSSVEGETIVLQGDISNRAQEWFVKKGVKKIVLGN